MSLFLLVDLADKRLGIDNLRSMKMLERQEVVVS
jgi:hypothetical protein